MENWNVYPDNWLDKRHGMISHIEGLKDKGWCIEAGPFNPHPLFGRPEWQTEYDLGYRYYVLCYNIYDGRQTPHFYKDPADCQKAFEQLRDPLGVHNQ